MTQPVCIDETDFKTDPGNGRLELNHVAAQNSPESFEFILDGDQDTFEKITDFDDVIVPETGYYTVTVDMRGKAVITTASPGTVVAASVSGQLRVNNAPVAGTETMLAMLSQGAPDTQEPASQTQGTGSCTRDLFLTAGQALSIWGKRNADLGTVTSILSDDDGRCRITLVRIGGV
jgi:hypothetical protein